MITVISIIMGIGGALFIGETGLGLYADFGIVLMVYALLLSVLRLREEDQ